MPDEPVLSYCAAEIRRYDRDRFLTALFAPPAIRENLFALYAFNHEIAKTRESVSEPMVGRIRLQWWREALDGIEANEPRKHEVVEALYHAQQSGLKIDSLRPLIDAREFDLDETAPRHWTNWWLTPEKHRANWASLPPACLKLMIRTH